MFIIILKTLNMFQNEYFVANIGFDTAANEPSKVSMKLVEMGYRVTIDHPHPTQPGGVLYPGEDLLNRDLTHEGAPAAGRVVGQQTCLMKWDTQTFWRVMRRRSAKRTNEKRGTFDSLRFGQRAARVPRAP